MLPAQLHSNRNLSVLMEARDGLSGAIAERASFIGHWAPGTSIAGPLLTRTLRQRVSAGVTLEDSWLRKINRGRHPLVDINEFSGHPLAVKGTVAKDLVLMPQIDAPMIGDGMDETTFPQTRKPMRSSFTRERAPRTRSLLWVPGRTGFPSQSFHRSTVDRPPMRAAPAATRQVCGRSHHR